jgi:hypothetical protein
MLSRRWSEKIFRNYIMNLMGSFTRTLKTDMLLAQISLCKWFNAACNLSIHLNIISRLKWKAPSENSIDFKLELKFPSITGRPNDPDFAAKPVFKLLAYYGDDRTTSGRREGRYEYFDLMDVPDEEWEQ